MTAILDKVKAGYGAAVAWIDNHPHITLWAATAALAGALVLGAVF